MSSEIGKWKVDKIDLKLVITFLSSSVQTINKILIP